MLSKKVLDSVTIQNIAAAAEAEAVAQKWVVTIAIVDDGGHLLWLKRMDNAAPISAQIAPEKARTAALGRRPSKNYEEMINNGRTAFLSVPNQGLLEGGEPIMIDGQCVGAIGISGVRPEQDSQIAQAGLRAVNV